MREKDSHPYQMVIGHECTEGRFRPYPGIVCSMHRGIVRSFRAEYDPIIKKYYTADNRHEQEQDLINSGRGHLLPLDPNKNNIFDEDRHDTARNVRLYWEMTPARIKDWAKKIPSFITYKKKDQ